MFYKVTKVGVVPVSTLGWLGQLYSQVNTAKAVERSEEESDEPHWIVVDDNPAVLQVISTIVNVISGAKISCYESGAEALAAFKKHPSKYQLVITDLEMPEMNGLELCRRLHAIAPHLKVLLATGNHAALDVPTAKVVGFSGVIYKPFSPTDLVNIIETLGLPSSSVREPELANRSTAE